jgi:hypothetical protein
MSAEMTLATIFPGLCDNIDMQLPAIPQSSDDICAALSSFVEKNKQSTIDENALAALLSVPNCKSFKKLHGDKIFILAAELLECMSRICADSGNIFDQPSNNKSSSNFNKELNELAQLCAESTKGWKPEKRVVNQI